MASASAPRFVKKREGEDGEGTRAKNDALRFARGALRSEAAMVDGRLLADFESVLSGNAIYLQNFHASARDYSVLANLAREMERAAELGARTNRAVERRVRAVAAPARCGAIENTASFTCARRREVREALERWKRRRNAIAGRWGSFENSVDEGGARATRVGGGEDREMY